MSVDGNNSVSVAVILGGVQGGLRIREYRIAELEGIGKRMETCHRGVTNAGEIKHKIIAGANSAQRLVRRCRDDRITRRGTGIVLGSFWKGRGCSGTFVFCLGSWSAVPVTTGCGDVNCPGTFVLLPEGITRKNGRPKAGIE